MFLYPGMWCVSLSPSLFPTPGSLICRKLWLVRIVLVLPTSTPFFILRENLYHFKVKFSLDCPYDAEISPLRKLWCFLQQLDLERGRAARNVSSTKRAAAISSSRQSSSVEATDGRSSRLVSSNGRLSITTQKNQSSGEPKPSAFARAPVKGSRDDLRSFEFLSVRK